MPRFVLVRLVHSVPVLVGIVIGVFLLVKLTPGDPAGSLLGLQATPEELATVRATLGLDRPWHEQFLRWAFDALRGDLGISYISRQPVAELIAQRLPVTVELTLVAMVIGAAFGVTAGVVSATRRYTALDYTITALALFGVSMPSFWFGILLILVFSLWLGILPASGYVPITRDPIEHVLRLIMPATSLGLFLAGALARFSRASMIEALVHDYVRTARAKGLSERIVVGRHALKNALIPTVTVLGIQFGTLLGGAVIIEQIFAYPGIGTLLLTAIAQRDYPVIHGVVLIVGAVFVLTNLVVDLAYTWLDPRIRFEPREGG